MRNLRRKSQAKGLTLIELCVTMAMVVLIVYLSLSALKPGVDSGSAHGLALAVKEELEASRQLAIRSGQPVALGIPTDNGGNRAACSLYRLQGWNTPYVKWSGGYEGDYPGAGFAAAVWSGAPSIGGPVDLPPSAKFFNFGINELWAWLPDDRENDYIFCYLPDGSLITNGLRTTAGRYPIVVAQAPTFGGATPGNVTISSGSNPWTIYVSPGGGVELIKGTPGTVLPEGSGNGTVSTPQARTENTGTSLIYLSEMKLRPDPADRPPGESICVPGQVVTLEIYAHCPQGDSLFANWTQTPGTISGNEGSFTYPTQPSTVLPNEADRMEFIPPNRIPTLPEPPVWRSGEEPAAGTGIWRAQWTWTVPVNSRPGDLYNVTANVQNAQADATIVTPPPSIKMNPAPEGRMVVERRVNGLWQLWRMNPDGSGEKLISPEGIQEMMPTIDRNGTQLACIREGPGGLNDRYIVIRSIDGGLEQIVAGPGQFTSVSISPTGEWVSYRNNATNRLITQRTDGTGRFEKFQWWSGSGATIKKGRSGWSFDGDFLLYGTQAVSQAEADAFVLNPLIYAVPLGSPGAVENDPGTNIYGPFAPSTAGLSRIFSPVAYRHPTTGREYVIVSGAGDDGFLVTFEVVGRNYNANHNTGAMEYFNPADLCYQRRVQIYPGDVTSAGLDDDYPSVSHDGKLTFTRSPAVGGAGVLPGEDTEDQEIWMLPNINADGVFVGPPVRVSLPDVRRAIFIPPGD